MTGIATSALVKHVSLGVGKVVAVEATAVHVFFPGAEKRYAAKLRWPAASALLSSDGVEPDPWLQGLTCFSFDARSGRYALAANFLTHEEAIAEFLQIFPQGFLDPAYVGGGAGKHERAARWRAAGAEWAQALGQGEGERLLAEGDVPELSRRALRVAAHLTRTAGVLDLDVLAEALEPGDVVKAFFEALFALLATPAPTRARFERLFAASESLGVSADEGWAMATLFPFLADPARFVPVMARLTSAAGARLGCDLKWKPRPNWNTYAALRALSGQLLEKLRPSGARDFMDVEAFLHCIGTRRPAASTSKADPRPKVRRDRSSRPAPRRKS